MGFMDKLKDTFTTADDEMEVELDETEAKALSDYEEPQNKGVQRLSGNTKMVLFEPRSFEEAEEVVILKMEVEDESENFIPVDDEDELNQVYDLFKERNKENFDFID